MKNENHRSFLLLRNLISQTVTWQEEDWQILTRYFEPKTVAKDTVLVEIGTPTKYIYFIGFGYLAIKLHYKQKDMTRHIAGKSSFLSAFPSFVSGYPSDERLVSLSDSELLRISKSDLYKFFDERPEIGRFVLNVKILASYLGMEPETFSKSLAQLS